EIPAVGRRDDVGALAGAVQIFKENMIQTRRLEEETAQARVEAEAQRKTGMSQMADSFDAAVGRNIGQVCAAAPENWWDLGGDRTGHRALLQYLTRRIRTV
ncbi:hypothetical protein MKL09_00130, partial [Methylobacterium sp. J-048]|nr:hypothetical protein [Methylobacterium sp. J-048]